MSLLRLKPRDVSLVKHKDDSWEHDKHTRKILCHEMFVLMCKWGQVVASGSKFVGLPSPPFRDARAIVNSSNEYNNNTVSSFNSAMVFILGALAN